MPTSFGRAAPGEDVLPVDWLELLGERRWPELAAWKGGWPEAGLAAPQVVELLLGLDTQERVLLFRALPRDVASKAFARLRPTTRDRLLLALTDGETQQLLADLPPDDRTALLSELPGQVTQRLLNLVPSEVLTATRRLLGYPKDSVGRLMTPDYLAVQPTWTVAEALEHIRERGREDETANTVFVVDEAWRLLDALPLQRFVLSDPRSTVGEAMDDKFISLDAHTDREEAVAKMRRYGHVALPVVDSGGVLIGLVTIDDVLGVADAETTEDFHLTSAVAPVREGYWEATVGLLFRRRIGWLVGLVVVNLVSSGVIAAYEEMLVTYVALAFFIPLLIDTGGNAGAQSATIMIRAISLGEVRAAQWGRAFLKEASLGLMIGATLGVLGLVLGIFRGGFAIGLIVMITMVVMLLLTNLLGVVLPFLLLRLGRDPAVASGPLITSVADALGLVIYFWVASWILGL